MKPGNWLIATTIVAVGVAVVWFLRLELVPRPDGTTILFNRLTGEMRICNRDHICIPTSRESKTAEQQAPAKAVPDADFERALDQAVAELTNELKEQSDLRRSQKDTTEKALDLIASVAIGAVTPLLRTWDYVLGSEYYENDWRLKGLGLSSDLGLTELERQSFWNTAAASLGIAMGVALMAALVLKGTRALFGVLLPRLRRLRQGATERKT